MLTIKSLQSLLLGTESTTRPTDSFSAVKRTLKNKNARADRRHDAVHNLGLLAKNGTAKAVPFLIECLYDNDGFVSGEAALTIPKVTLSEEQYPDAINGLFAALVGKSSNGFYSFKHALDALIEIGDASACQRLDNIEKRWRRNPKYRDYANQLYEAREKIEERIQC